ncbi:MAG: helicase-associated domain-containing protein [Planctomycetes bacterium]|nr:helicase-associated domain-containing protein [Planctomycetota bacterium]
MSEIRIDTDGRGDLYKSFTLKGFVDEFYTARARAANQSADGARALETYKLYSEDRAILSRLRKLSPSVNAIVGKAVEEFGGVLPRSVFDRLSMNGSTWSGDVWRRELESHFLGTVRELSLAPYGIHAGEETLVLFHEVVLARLKAISEERPATVVKEVEMGVDLVSDIARFLAFLQEDHVRFTVHGELFKTSEKRLVDQFVPGIDADSKEPSPHEVLDFIYHFCSAERLVHRTGDRTYTISEKGLQWEKQPLLEKQKDLLLFSVEDRGLPGDLFHQIRLRRHCLSYLKRMEPERWYDAMFLPFVARNAYIAGMDPKTVLQFYSARANGAGGSAPLDDLQQMGWNLLLWIRRRLALLGIVDLGLDAVGRPVAIRFSRLGAKLLGVLPPSGLRGGRSHIIMNPNFEIVLLPEGDEFELAHALDRFCVRKKHEILYHYELTEESLRRGMRDGLRISEVLHLFTRHVRGNLPQNIVFSIHEWAERMGVVWLEGNTLRSRHLESIERLFTAPRIASHVADRPSADMLVLRPGTNFSELRSIARDLGLSVERP